MEHIIQISYTGMCYKLCGKKIKHENGSAFWRVYLLNLEKKLSNPRNLEQVKHVFEQQKYNSLFLLPVAGHEYDTM